MADQTPDVGGQDASFAPDFFFIPSAVMFDTELQPLDAKVFAVVYWFERMKDGYCRASNATIAKIAGAKPNSVNNSLARLRVGGHIACDYDENNNRLAIVTLHQMRYTPTSNEVAPPTSNEVHIKNNNNKEYITSTDAENDQASKLHKLYILHYKFYPTHRHTMTDEERKDTLNSLLAKYKLTPKRKKVAVTRLRDAGYELCAKAIVNSAKNEFNLGHNDRGWKADLYEYILRSYEQVEKLSQYGE